jgi:rubrerythrin
MGKLHDGFRSLYCYGIPSTAAVSGGIAVQEAEIVRLLMDLIHLDIDAVHVYAEAIEHVGKEEIRQNLADFRNDHRDHVAEIGRKLIEYGQIPPEFSPNFKGFIMEGMTALLSIRGEEGLLSGIETVENMSLRKYGDAAEPDLPPDLVYLIRSNLGDEERHLEYIQELLKVYRDTVEL